MSAEEAIVALRRAENRKRDRTVVYDQFGLFLFVLTYAGIALGGVPGLALDRTGVALLGAMGFVLSGILTVSQATQAIDYPTLILLFGFMLLSAQFRLGGFYSRAILSLAERRVEPANFLAGMVFLSAGLSALLSNDVICLALAPITVEIALHRHWDPKPFLFALAAASNIGSAATIVGNPQNMFIGQTANLDFGIFLLWCLPPSIMSVAVLYVWARWKGHVPAGHSSSVLQAVGQAHLSLNSAQPWDRYQSTKAAIMTVVVVALLFTSLPRHVVILGMAAVLLLSRRLTTSSFLALVDWPLLLLFIALFMVIEGFRQSGGLSLIEGTLMQNGLTLYHPLILSLVSAGLSNFVSNVPAVMLLMAEWPEGETMLAYLLALTSTYAGNLILLGSIANLIVVEQARRFGIVISFREHLIWTGPVAVVSLIIAIFWWYAVKAAV